MPTPSEAQPTFETPITDVRALVGDKYQTAFGVVMDKTGANPALTADLLYDALYQPKEVIALHHIEPSEKYPDRIATLEASPLPLHGTAPARDEFIDTLRDAVTRQIDHAACLFPKAINSVELAMEKGPTAIWTAGDMWGNGADIPGSLEQVKKVVGSGIAALRYRSHIGSAAAGMAGGKGNIKDALTLIAAENKFSEQSIARLGRFFERQGITTINILEDRLQNIERLQPLLGAEGITAYGIWVRQGKHTETNHGFDPTSITAVATIGEAAEVIKTQPQGRGFVFDFDGVLSDQNKRMRLQTAAVQMCIDAHGWV